MKFKVNNIVKTMYKINEFREGIIVDTDFIMPLPYKVYWPMHGKTYNYAGDELILVKEEAEKLWKLL